MIAEVAEGTVVVTGDAHRTLCGNVGTARCAVSQVAEGGMDETRAERH